MFVGTIPPGGSLASALNYELVTQAFYVSDYNLVAGDGQPTLKKAALVAGPEVYTPAIGTSQEIVSSPVSKICRFSMALTPTTTALRIVL